MKTTPWSIQIAWKCFSNHSIRFMKCGSDERRDYVKMGWNEYCVTLIIISTYIFFSTIYFNIEMISQPKRHQNRKSNSKMWLVSLNLQCAFIVLHTKCVFFSLLFRSSCHYQFDIWIEEQWKRNKQNKKCCDRSRRINCQLLFIISCVAVFFFLFNFALTISSIFPLFFYSHSEYLPHMVFV